eukprot:9340872-Alexandrium_andersonii.AAC.1
MADPPPLSLSGRAERAATNAHNALGGENPAGNCTTQDNAGLNTFDHNSVLWGTCGRFQPQAGSA